ncbi:MAG: VWA domain-containing protein [Phycisphaerales bacterium]|nr:VWA domain-containing protein [Phycisphaerales bacterium]
MAVLRRLPVHSAERIGLIVLVVACSVLLHLLLLSLVRWPAAAATRTPETVTLTLRPPVAQPVAAAPVASGTTMIDLTPATEPAPAPAQPTVPVLDLPVVDGSTGQGASGGSGMAAGVSIEPGLLVDVGPVQVPARRMVFLVDVSASMGGSLGRESRLADAASEAVCTALRGLPDTVQFRVMLFSGAVREPLGDRWLWPSATDDACAAVQAALATPSGLTRTGAVFDEAALHTIGAEALVLVTDGGIQDLEAGTLAQWLEYAPSVRLDVVLIGPVGTPDAAQRQLEQMARRSGGGLHRLFGGAP